MRYHRLPLAALCFFSLCAGVFGQPARGPLLKADLWIDPRAMHLDDPVVAGMLEAMQYDRVIISSFVAGTTLLPTKNKIFPQIEYYKGKEDLVRRTVERLHARKIKVYAAFDCFRWADGKGPNLFKQNPDLAAVGPSGGVRLGLIFGSPFNPTGRRVLKELATDFAETLADFDGVLFCPRLGRYFLSDDDHADPLGFSRPDQKSLLEETGLNAYEAADVRLSDKDDQIYVLRDPASFRKWKNWRQEKVTSILKEVKDIIAAKMSTPGLAVQVSADFYQSSLEIQNELLEDSVEFVRRAGFDEVVIWVMPNTPKAGANYQQLRQRLAKEFPQVSTAVLVPVCENYVLNGETMEKSLRGRTAERVVIWGSEDQDDYGDFEMFKRQYDDFLKYVMPRKDLRDLELDPRLQVHVHMDGQEDSSLLRQFDDLKRQTRVSFGIQYAKPAMLEYGGGVGGFPAWYYMQTIVVQGRSFQGRWEKINEGYDFVVTWPVAEPEEKTPPASNGSGILWWAALAVLISATIGGIVVFLKRKRQ